MNAASHAPTAGSRDSSRSTEVGDADVLRALRRAEESGVSDAAWKAFELLSGQLDSLAADGQRVSAELVESLLAHEHPRARLAGVWLAEYPPNYPETALLRIARADPDDDVRERALKELVRVHVEQRRGPPLEALDDVMIAAARDPSLDVREVAHELLPQLGPRAAEFAAEILVSAGIDGHTAERLTAALVRAGRAAPLLDRGVSHRLLRAAAEAFSAEFGSEEPEGLAERRARATTLSAHYVALASVLDPMERWGLFHAVNAVGDAAYLLAIARSPSAARSVRFSAIDVLLSSDEQRGTAARTAAGLLDDEETPAGLCRDIVETLGSKFHSELSAYDVVLTALRRRAATDPDPWVRAAAVAAVEQVSD